MTYTKPPKRMKKEDILGKGTVLLEEINCRAIDFEGDLSKHLYTNEIFEVDVVTDGNGICQVFGQAIPCKKGDIFIIPSDIPHSCYVAERSDRMQIRRLLFDINDWFSGNAVNIGDSRFCYGIFGSGAVIAYATLNSKMYARVTSYLNEIAVEISEKRKNWEENVRALLSMLFVAVERYIGEADRNSVNLPKKWHNVGIAVRTVIEDFGDCNLSLERIADAIHISKSHLSKLFKELTGENFAAYLRNMRLSHACKLLCETNMTVEQIVTECGMCDVRSFYKNFQSYTGVTPSQYKENKKRIKR